MIALLKRFKRWYEWQKNYYGFAPVHKLFVLLGVAHSPTFELYYSSAAFELYYPEEKKHDGNGEEILY